MRLEQLFDKTRDGMVAFELALLEETSGRMERAIDWYKRAWQRFRRTEWKQKAEEALSRHGVPLPLAEEPLPERADVSPSRAEAVEPPGERISEPFPDAAPDRAAETPEHGDFHEPVTETSVAPSPEVGFTQERTTEPQATPDAPVGPHRRRHRGGRGRGRGKRVTEGVAKIESAPESHAQPTVSPQRPSEPEHRPPAERHPVREQLPSVHIYRRSEPALASQIKTLEAKLRQLLASTPHSLGDPNEWPANPGVFLLSDLDLTTIYYLEACGNMRSAMDQLVSGRRGRQGAVRSKLAKYLGISDSQAGRYLKQHCATRWIDLEESDSNALGHFARAVLRPELMDDEN